MTYDPGVIIRAHRFRAEMVGFKLVRGHYAGGDADLATRWYVVPLVVAPECEHEHRQSGGYSTIADAVDAAITSGTLKAVEPASRGERDLRSEYRALLQDAETATHPLHA